MQLFLLLFARRIDMSARIVRLLLDASADVALQDMDPEHDPRYVGSKEVRF